MTPTCDPATFRVQAPACLPPDTGEFGDERGGEQFHSLCCGLDPTGPVDDVRVIHRQPVAETCGVPHREFGARRE